MFLRSTFFILAFLLTCSASPYSFAEEKECPPIVVFEFDPFQLLPGFQSPSFALYTNKVVIFRDVDGLKSATLSDEEFDEVSLYANSIFSSDARYLLSDETDLMATEFLACKDHEKKSVLILGPLHNADSADYGLPQGLKTLHDSITNLDLSRAQPWLPEKAEVFIVPYINARAEPIPWPEAWPDLEDDQTVRRDFSSYSLFIDIDQLSAVKTFLTSSAPPKNAIEINGKLWSAYLHYPFPHEEIWRPPSKYQDCFEHMDTGSAHNNHPHPDILKECRRLGLSPPIP